MDRFLHCEHVQSRERADLLARTSVLGKPYHFVEVKDWQDMSYTGNLKAMIEYIKSVP